MPTLTKPVQQPPALFVSTPLSNPDKIEILKILNQEKAARDKIAEIIRELEIQITHARNHMQNREWWPTPQHTKASLKRFLKSAKSFENCLKQTIDNIHLRCVLRNQGRRNVIDHIHALNRKGIHEDFLELIYQTERAIEDTQKAGKGHGGQKNKRLRESRERIKRDLEAKIYNKYFKPEPSRPCRDKANREDFWSICKSYIY